eukprot:Clim_evm32s143 gene=Clim_evmTU32s143
MADASSPAEKRTNISQEQEDDLEGLWWENIGEEALAEVLDLPNSQANQTRTTPSLRTLRRKQKKDPEVWTTDIEDIIKSEDDVRNPTYSDHQVISVTGLCKALWCEYKYVYDRVRGQEETPAMKSGIEIHDALEAEVHDMEEVYTETKTDIMAIKLANMVVCMTEVITNGLTREMPLYGIVRTMGGDCLWFSGIIDEVRWTAAADLPERIPRASTPEMKTADMDDMMHIEDEEQWHGRTIENRSDLTDSTVTDKSTAAQPPPIVTGVVISDAKTRVSNTVPKPDSASMHSVKLQLNVYAIMWECMRKNELSWTELFARLGVDDQLPFCSSVQNALTRQGLGEHKRLGDLCGMVDGLASNLAPVSGLEAVWYAQNDQKRIGSHIWKEADLRSSVSWANAIVRKKMKFFNQKRPMTGVNMVNVWKCEYCGHRDSCAWRDKQARKLTERVAQHQQQPKENPPQYQ